ncbi:MAG: hypothetical protein FWH16_01165 [Oscillospiraceae bacterium]|nr:hypothetical protein [Oscillospiraceae bacterium]
MNKCDETAADTVIETAADGETIETPMDVDDDIADFRQAYPGVRLDKLVTSPAFLSFGKNRFGIEPFKEIYKEYKELVRIIEGEALARRERRSRRSTGSGQSEPFTGLSREQTEQLDLWNKTYPHLRMTANEFLNR